jgi:hypothetical protein
MFSVFAGGAPATNLGTITNVAPAAITVILTEVSSNVLTANLGTVTYVGPNLWTWGSPDGGNIFFWQPPKTQQAFWTEPPSEPSEYNIVIAYGTPIVRVSSDIFSSNGNQYGPTFANGQIANSLFIDWLGTSFTVYNVQFIDNAASSETPEPATLLLLLAGSGLIGIKRFWRSKVD